MPKKAAIIDLVGMFPLPRKYMLKSPELGKQTGFS